MTSWTQGLALGALRRLPVHLMSRAMGRVASWRLPAPIQRAEIRLFAAAVGVDWSEVRDPIDRFDSLQAFFTRALAPGVRPIDPDPSTWVGPCDGAWGAAGRVEDGTLLQLKGRPYSLGALLGSDAQAVSFEGGSFATFYLSPRDYHRLHTPCDLAIEHARYLPGTLWPVNRLGVEGVDGLFAQNERIVAFARTPSGGRLCLVAVGATMVGRVCLSFDRLTTNAPPTLGTDRSYPGGGPTFARGEEWGRFEFGSTLVLVAEPGVVALDETASGTQLRLGRRIGTGP